MNRMPFGLRNAPETFQRSMNTILSGLQGSKCVVYLDDIVIYGNSLQDHNESLIQIFKRFEFLRKDVAYLGHIISDEGVQPNPYKIKAIVNINMPKNPKDIKSF